MVSVTKPVESYKYEDVVLNITDNASALTATEFFELCGELYESMCYMNKVNIKIKGLYPYMNSKIKIRPTTRVIDGGLYD